MNLKNRINKAEAALAQTGGAWTEADQISDETFMAWLLWTRHADYERPVLTPAQEAYCRHRLDEIMDSIAAAGREHNFKQSVYSEEEIRRSTASIPQSVYDKIQAADRLAATETQNPQ